MSHCSFIIVLGRHYSHTGQGWGTSIQEIVEPLETWRSLGECLAVEVTSLGTTGPVAPVFGMQNGAT